MSAATGDIGVVLADSWAARKEVGSQNLTGVRTPTGRLQQLSNVEDGTKEL
jgi:hypothetical protein